MESCKVDTKLVSQALVKRKHLTWDAEKGSMRIGEVTFNPPTMNSSRARSLAAWSQYCRLSPTIYGNNTFTIRDLTGCKASYDKEKAASVNKFLECLQKHHEMHFLLEIVEDIDELSGGDTPTPLLFLALRGVKTPSKLTLLNSCVMVFLVNHRMRGFNMETDSVEDPKFFFQPNTTMKMLNHLFALLKTHGIVIAQSDLKHGLGNYHAYLADIWNKAALVRPEFGRLPNRAPTAFDDEEKMRTCEPELRPFEDGEYSTALSMGVYKTSRDFGLRGPEVSCCLLLLYLLIVAVVVAAVV